MVLTKPSQMKPYRASHLSNCSRWGSTFSLFQLSINSDSRWLKSLYPAKHWTQGKPVYLASFWRTTLWRLLNRDKSSTRGLRSELSTTRTWTSYSMIVFSCGRVWTRSPVFFMTHCPWSNYAKVPVSSNTIVSREKPTQIFFPASSFSKVKR